MSPDSIKWNHVRDALGYATDASYEYTDNYRGRLAFPAAYTGDLPEYAKPAVHQEYGTIFVPLDTEIGDKIGRSALVLAQELSDTEDLSAFARIVLTDQSGIAVAQGDERLFSTRAVKIVVAPDLEPVSPRIEIGFRNKNVPVGDIDRGHSRRLMVTREKFKEFDTRQRGALIDVVRGVHAAIDASRAKKPQLFFIRGPANSWD